MKTKMIRLSAVLVFLAGLGIFIFPYAYDRYAAYKSDKVMEQFNSELEEFETLLENPSVSDEIERIRASFEQEESGKNDPREGAYKGAQEDGKADVSADKKTLEDAKKLLQLYSEMCDYNSKIYAVGQQNIKDPFSYEKPSIDLKKFGFKDNVIGILTIDAMNVEMPLYLGASKSNMKKGAAVLGQTSMPTGQDNTNMVIAAHRGYRGMAMFRDIQKLSFGDRISVRTPFETLVYEVTQTRVILPDENEYIMIVPGKRMITLSTCHPYTKNTHRYLVYGELKERNGNTVPMEGDAVGKNEDAGEKDSDTAGKNADAVGKNETGEDGEKKNETTADGQSVSGNVQEDGKERAFADRTEEGIRRKQDDRSQTDPNGEISFDEDEKIMMLERWVPVAGIIILTILTIVCIKKRKET